jgi:CMP-N-acetylneuraminic acid synthetase
MKRKLVCLILARKNSRRLPSKHLKDLGSKRLISWTCDFANKIKGVHRIILSTDDNKILNIYKNSKIITIKRPDRYSRDNSTSAEAAIHAINWYEKKFDLIDDVILLQPTSPYRKLSNIYRGIKKFYKYKNVPTISVHKSVFVFNKSFIFKKIAGLNMLTKPSSKQESSNKKINYMANGNFYIISKKDLINNKTFIVPIMMPIILSSKAERIDIDTFEDLKMAEKFLKYYE